MTTHIGAEKEDIADIVIMPGDPLRAKYIAENYLKNVKLVSNVRLALIYTGYYNEKRVTVASSGMGMPSMGIYSYELFKEYGVNKIIRVGSCGSYHENIKVKDIILVENAYTLSNFALQYYKEDVKLVGGSKTLNQKIMDSAKNSNLELKMGNIFTSDIFYSTYLDSSIKENYCLGVEMETFALFYIANKLGKEASSILTVTDSIITNEEMAPIDRERKLNDAISLALNSITL